METWKPVAGYEGAYEVSDLGQVRSLDRIGGRGRRFKGKLLVQHLDGSGYPFVSLCSHGKALPHSVARLVLEAFVGACPPNMEACHFPDPNRENNRLTNLRWDTRSSNHADKLVHGTDVRGEKHGQAKLTTEQVLSIRGSNLPHAELARQFGVGPTQISRIRNHERWSHVCPS